jgi:tetratricopeptide (TPR) repeat protein
MVRTNAADDVYASLRWPKVSAFLRTVDHEDEQTSEEECNGDVERAVANRKTGQDTPKAGAADQADRSHALDRILEAGREHYDAGNLEEAAACYRVALQLRKDSLNALYSLGVISGQLHRYEEAKEMFTRLLDLLNKSYNITNRENLSAAGRSYQEVFAAAHEGLGATSLNMWGTAGPKEPPRELAVEAEREFREATKLDPGSFGGWYGLGISLHILEQLDESEAAFKKALEIEPGSNVANERLRAVLADKLERRLFELGYLRGLRKPIYDFTPYENRSLIELQGKPVSEIVVEDRG